MNNKLPTLSPVVKLNEYIKFNGFVLESLFGEELDVCRH